MRLTGHKILNGVISLVCPLYCQHTIPNPHVCSPFSLSSSEGLYAVEELTILQVALTSCQTIIHCHSLPMQ